MHQCTPMICIPCFTFPSSPKLILNTLSPQDKVTMLSINPVVILGATGTGKTKLSVDVCKLIDGEVVNADKMQLYAGLDITTNKVSQNDRCGIPHHLIGVVSVITGDVPGCWFRSIATTTAKSIVSRGRVPVIAGGSNSLIHGFLADHLDPRIGDPFVIGRYQPKLRFRSCLLWLQANELVLNEYLNHRVDEMIGAGSVEELREYFDTIPIDKNDFHNGLARAIGVRELRNYFSGCRGISACIDDMKANTRALAKSQSAKIRHIVDVWGWPVHALDVTETIHARLNGQSHTAENMIWNRDVSFPALTAIGEFLHN